MKSERNDLITRVEELKKLEDEDDIIENYFANMKLRETTWKEWEKLEEQIEILTIERDYLITRVEELKE